MGPNSLWSNFDDSDDDREYDDGYSIEHDDGVSVEQLADMAGIDLSDYRRDHYND